MDIGETLRFFRTKLKLAQKDFAPKYIDSSAYSRIEGNKRSLKIDELQEILYRTGVTIDEFISFSDFDEEQQNFRELYYYCAEHLENKTTKKQLLSYYYRIKELESKNLIELSNFLVIKNYFYSRWKEVDKITKTEVDIIYNSMLEKSLYLHYDYVITSNIIRFFDPKQIDIIVHRLIPMKLEEKRSYETKKFMLNILTNVISLKIYQADYNGANKFLKLASKQNKPNTDYNFKLHLQYLKNLYNYLLSGDMEYSERIYDFIHILEDMGEVTQANQVKEEVRMLTHNRDTDKVLNTYSVGLLKK